MSWDKAKTEAEEIYKNLRAKHSAGFIRMVLRALVRKLDGEEKMSHAHKTPTTTD